MLKTNQFSIPKWSNTQLSPFQLIGTRPNGTPPMVTFNGITNSDAGSSSSELTTKSSSTLVTKRNELHQYVNQVRKRRSFHAAHYQIFYQSRRNLFSFSFFFPYRQIYMFCLLFVALFSLFFVVVQGD